MVKMVQVQCALFQTVVQFKIHFVCLFAPRVFSTSKFQDDLHQQSSCVFCSSGQLKTRILYEELFSSNTAACRKLCALAISNMEKQFALVSKFTQFAWCTGLSALAL